MNTKDVQKTTKDNFVPGQQLGTRINALESLYCKSEEEAKRLFEEVKGRLLDVNAWKCSAAGKFPEVFLKDDSGKLVERKAQVGDLIQFIINGEKCNWASIKEIVQNQREHGELVQLIVEPISKQGELEKCVKSVFQVRRRGKLITAEEQGNNDLPNADIFVPINSLLNSFISWGSKMGTSYPIWKALMTGILKRNTLQN